MKIGGERSRVSRPVRNEVAVAPWCLEPAKESNPEAERHNELSPSSNVDDEHAKEILFH